MASRWEKLLDQKPVPLLDALVEQVARLLASELAKWPLPVESVDLPTLGRLATQLTGEHPAPGGPVYTAAFRLAGWELTRETEAFDDFMRNHRYLEEGVAPAERVALLFITRWLVEQLLALSEVTGGRVKRPELVRCLEHTARLWMQSRQAGDFR